MGTSFGHVEGPARPVSLAAPALPAGDMTDYSSVEPEADNSELVVLSLGEDSAEPEPQIPLSTAGLSTSKAETGVADIPTNGTDGPRGSNGTEEYYSRHLDDGIRSSNWDDGSFSRQSGRISRSKASDGERSGSVREMKEASDIEKEARRYSTPAQQMGAYLNK